MRVALTVYNTNFLGGGNKFTAELASTLAQSGFEVAICAGNKPIPGRCHDEFLQASRVYTAHPLRPSRRGKLYTASILVAAALRRCLNRFKPHFVVNADSPPAVYRLVKKKDEKFIQYVHWPTELQRYRHSILLELYRAFYWGFHYESLSRIDAVVCNSNYTRNITHLLWLREVPKAHFTVIYPPVDTRRYSEFSVERRRKVCYVGRLDEKKGIDWVIEAFLNVQREIPNCELEIAGAVNPGDVYTTSYYPRLLRKLTDLGNEAIKLSVNPSDREVVQVYKSSRCFANYNPGEHFGICAIESQAAGTVPIVARGGGQIETVKDGETGFLLDDPHEMVNPMSELLKEDGVFEEMSLRAMERAKMFSREAFSAEWLRLFDQLG